MQFNAKYRPLVAIGMLLAATQAQATLVSYTAKDGVEVVYSSVSDVTWTKDANLLGSMFASQGFDEVVNQILTVSPTITNTPNAYSPSGTYVLSSYDFHDGGQATWFGARAFIDYLNSIKYAGSDQWRLPTTVGAINGVYNTSNGSTAGNEYSELFYQELGGTLNHTPNTAIFDNEQPSRYWAGTEYERPGIEYVAAGFAWQFDIGFGYQDYWWKSYVFNAWALTSGQITAVPEPDSVVLLLVGLSLVGGVVRCCHQNSSVSF